MDGTPGRVHQLNVKPATPGQHGLPKQAVDSARVTRTGMDGDWNNYRHDRKRDDPDMALLLIPLETLADLRRAGWPVRPGDLGENVTTEGVPYEELPPGTRARIGRKVEIEVARPCEPCKNLYALPFVGPERGPSFLQATLGRRGWYARVVGEGVVARGDAIRIL